MTDKVCTCISHLDDSSIKTRAVCVLGASYIHKNKKVNFTYSADGFYVCMRCRGLVKAKCTCCATGIQLANKYNFDSGNVICDECVEGATCGTIEWHLPNDYFAVTPKAEVEMKEVEYRGATIYMPYYRNDRYNTPRTCMCCCRKYTDKTHLADMVDVHLSSFRLTDRAKNNVCGGCIVDYFRNSGVFVMHKRDMNMFVDGKCGYDDDIL